MVIVSEEPTNSRSLPCINESTVGVSNADPSIDTNGSLLANQNLL